MSSFPTWLYDELQQTGVDFEDTAQVAIYDRNQKSSTPEAERALIERLDISEGHTVIDLGAGTGTFANCNRLAIAFVFEKQKISLNL
jgi:ubiquinone/menaquinone biosynthesis C-methylase UbiE